MLNIVKNMLELALNQTTLEMLTKISYNKLIIMVVR